MSVVCVVVVPSAPLLLPELTGPDADDLAPVRAAVGEAVAELVGAASEVTIAGAAAAGRLTGMGAPVPVPAREPVPGAGWVHDLGRILLARAGFAGPATDLVLTAERPSGEPSSPGHPSEPASGGRHGVLVLAGGGATRGPRAPGGGDPHGAVVDARIATDLAVGREPRVDPDEARRLATTSTAAVHP